MKIGDLVYFSPVKSGSLTSVKYFSRIYSQTKGSPGIILDDHGKNLSVIFGEKILVINKAYLSLKKPF